MAQEMCSSIAERRRTDQSHLVKSLQGELDRIIMKCLEKNQEIRFQTVSSLTASLQNYLKAMKSAGQPQPASSSLASEPATPASEKTETAVGTGKASDSTSDGMHPPGLPYEPQPHILELTKTIFEHFWLADSILYGRDEVLGKSKWYTIPKQIATKPLLFLMPIICGYECSEGHYALGFYWFLCVVLFSYLAFLIRKWRNIP